MNPGSRFPRTLFNTQRPFGRRVLWTALAAIAVAATAQTNYIANGTGDFTVPGNWSAGVPNSSTNATVTNGTSALPTFVDLANATGNTLNLTIGANNTFNIGLNATFGIYGTSLINNGTINLLGGFATNSFFNVNNNVTLSGNGTLNISYGDHNGTAVIQQSGGSYTLTNASNIIQGDGIIGNGGLTLANNSGGIINANTSGQALTLNGTGGITNAGLLEATAGGVLQITTSVANTGGTVLANSGNVVVNGSITGGTLSTSGTGVLQTQAGATTALSGVTISSGSTYTSGFNTTTGLNGTIVNNGTLQLTAGSGNNATLRLDGNTTLQGGGSLVMNSGDLNGTATLVQGAPNLTLNNVDNKISGYGVIGNGGLTVVNGAAGVINANASGNTLTLNGSGGITNNGLMEGTNGGTLQLSTTVANSSGSIAAAGGTVNISTTVNGGTLSSSGGGTLQTVGTATLNGVTFANGTTYLGGVNSTTNVSGTITNPGTIQLTAGSGTNAFLNINGDTTLQGGGAVTLNSGDNNGLVYIQQTGGASTLNNIDNKISGYGVIGNGGLGIVNGAAGVINANAAGNTLTLNGSGGITNHGLLEATNGGTLQISSNVANQGATISAATGTVGISSTIQGGTLTGGNLQTVNSATLDGATAGALTLGPGSIYTGNGSTNTTVLGTINNDGSIRLNAGSGTNSQLSIAGNTTLQGGGSITLNNGDANGQPYISQSGGTYTLTNVNNTIQGAATIGNGGLTLVNQAAGTIDANINGHTLLLNGGGGVTNTGLLEATNGGILQISTAVNNQNGTISAGSGTVDISNTITGGTLSGANLYTASAATLDGATNGPITLATGSVLTGGFSTNTTVLGTVNNQGTISLQAGSGANSYLSIGGNTILQGGGQITMNDGDANGQPYISQSASNVVLTNVNNTISGAGTIGNGGLTFNNLSSGVVDANISGHALVLNGSGGVVNTGTLEATNGGILQVNTNVVNQGGLIAGAGGTVGISSTIEGGTLSGALHTTNSATLDGATAGAITLAPGTIYTSGPSTATSVTGTINNQGAINFSAGGGSNAYLYIAGNTTLQGGGTVNLSAVDSNGQVYISQSVPNATLTNADNLIQGSGTIGQGALTFVNGAAGTVLANTPGLNLLINGSGGVTNNGTLEANAGSTLVVQSNLTNFSGNTLTGGTYIVNGATGNTGTVQLSTLGNNAGGEIVNNAAKIILNGPTANTLLVDAGGNNALQPLAANLAAGSLTLTGGYNFAPTGNLTNAGSVHIGGGGSGLTVSSGNTYSQTGGSTLIDSGGTLTAGTANISGGTVQLAGGTVASGALTNGPSGLITGYGNIQARPTNQGTIDASGGTLTVSNGISGPTGTIKVDPGATLSLAGGALGSTTGTLTQNGTLALGSNNITVSNSYTNANFGTGNSFNNHADVTGTGQILASGNTTQTITGPAVVGGTTATPQLQGFGNIRIGDTSTVNYNITNGGTTGPALIGAIQTSVNGGNITDSRLSGTGVTAGNYGPLASGQSQNFAVTLTGTTAGALASGQEVHIANNFDNVAGQTLTLGSGAVYQTAQANTLPATVNLGNVHVGGALTGQLGVTNIAPNTNGYTETLGATVSGTTGLASTSGSVSGLAQGQSSNAISVGLNSTTAGALSGSATLAFTSSAVNNSGLGTIGVGSQTVALTGAAYRLADPTLTGVSFGNVLLNSTQTRFIGVTNSATADGFSEGLNALLGSFSGTGSNLLSGSGSITNLAAGLSNNSGLLVTLNTSATGQVTATVQVLLASNGAGTSGLGLTALPAQNVAVTGQITGTVGTLAAASAATPNPINLGNVRIGAISPTQDISLSNIATGPAEGLNASVSTASSGLTANGSFSNLAAGATNNTSLVVGMNTTTAGSKSGSVSVTTTSDGTFNNGVTTALGTQAVAVTGAVYQTASATVLPTSPINLGSSRINGTLGQNLSITNSAPNTNGYTETLGGSVTGTTGSATAGGSFAGVAQGSSSNAINVGLMTNTAGVVSGSATVGFTSSAVNNSGLGTIGAGSQTVGVTGTVYQTAAAALLPTTLNLGVVRSGTVINTNLAISNVAPATGGFTETLGASFGAASSGLSGTGSISGLAVGGSSNQMSLAFTAGAAGVYSGSAAVNFASQAINNSGLGSLALASQSVNVSAMVNAIAQVGLTGSGSAAFNFTGANTAVLNFGTITVGANTLLTSLNLSNLAGGPADALLGSIDISQLAGLPFSLLGTTAFDLNAGGLEGFQITFNASNIGFYSANIVIDAVSHNGSQSDLALNPITVTIEGQIQSAGSGLTPVPEPSTYGAIGSAVLALAVWNRRRRSGGVVAKF